MSSLNFIETLAIGDELLTGKIADTNSAFIAARLFELGIRLHRSSVVADDESEIVDVLGAVSKRSRVAIVFGGLGPTSDDKTAEVVTRLIGGSLTVHEPSRQRLIRFMADRKREINATVLKQVNYPEKAEPILNPEGLAPAFTVQWQGCRFYFLPGVPIEMKAIWTSAIQSQLVELHKETGAAGVLHHGWRLLGIPESEVQRLMDPVEAALPPGVWLGYRTHFPENHLVLYVSSASKDAPHLLEAYTQKITPLVAPFLYTEEEKDLEVLIHDLLKAKNKTLALAESCTGGLASYRLTKIPGLSAHFWGSEVVYQMAAKNAVFGLGLTREEQTVSADCSKHLAEALFKKSGCDVVAAITGYLGPAGGTEENPPGTLYIHVKSKTHGVSSRFSVMVRDRERAQWGAATYLFYEIVKRLRSEAQ